MAIASHSARGTSTKAPILLAHRCGRPCPSPKRLRILKDLGFDAMQFHDDDAVPNLDELTPGQIAQQARAMRQMLADHGLVAEFVAPRLWEHPKTIDGAFTANDPKAPPYAIERSKKAADIGRELGTDLMVLWLAREGTYLREAKDAVRATQQPAGGGEHAAATTTRDLRIAIEPKPNEPMDLAYIPTIGHALALGFQATDPARVGVLVESAHAILAGLDPSDEMALPWPLTSCGACTSTIRTGSSSTRIARLARSTCAGPSTRCGCWTRTHSTRMGMVAWTSRPSAPSRPSSLPGT